MDIQTMYGDYNVVANYIHPSGMGALVLLLNIIIYYFNISSYTVH